MKIRETDFLYAPLDFVFHQVNTSIKYLQQVFCLHGDTLPHRPLKLGLKLAVTDEGKL